MFASKVVRKKRVSPGVASSLPQIHCGTGAAVGSGGALIWSQKFGAVDGASARAEADGLSSSRIADLVDGAAHVAEVATIAIRINQRDASFFCIRTRGLADSRVARARQAVDARTSTPDHLTDYSFRRRNSFSLKLRSEVTLHGNRRCSDIGPGTQTAIRQRAQGR